MHNVRFVAAIDPEKAMTERAAELQKDRDREEKRERERRNTSQRARQIKGKREREKNKNYSEEGSQNRSTDSATKAKTKTDPNQSMTKLPTKRCPTTCCACDDLEPKKKKKIAQGQQQLHTLRRCMWPCVSAICT